MHSPKKNSQYLFCVFEIIYLLVTRGIEFHNGIRLAYIFKFFKRIFLSKTNSRALQQASHAAAVFMSIKMLY